MYTNFRDTETDGVPLLPVDLLMTADDLALYLQVPKQTLYAWRVDGRGPTALRVGRYLRYRWSDVDAWIKSCADDRGSVGSAGRRR